MTILPTSEKDTNKWKKWWYSNTFYMQDCDFSLLYIPNVSTDLLVQILSDLSTYLRFRANDTDQGTFDAVDHQWKTVFEPQVFDWKKYLLQKQPKLSDIPTPIDDAITNLFQCIKNGSGVEAWMQKYTTDITNDMIESAKRKLLNLNASPTRLTLWSNTNWFQEDVKLFSQYNTRFVHSWWELYQYCWMVKNKGLETEILCGTKTPTEFETDKKQFEMVKQSLKNLLEAVANTEQHQKNARKIMFESKNDNPSWFPKRKDAIWHSIYFPGLSTFHFVTMLEDLSAHPTQLQDLYYKKLTLSAGKEYYAYYADILAHLIDSMSKNMSFEQWAQQYTCPKQYTIQPQLKDFIDWSDKHESPHYSIALWDAYAIGLVLTKENQFYECQDLSDAPLSPYVQKMLNNLKTFSSEQVTQYLQSNKELQQFVLKSHNFRDFDWSTQSWFEHTYNEKWLQVYIKGHSTYYLYQLCKFIASTCSYTANFAVLVLQDDARAKDLNFLYQTFGNEVRTSLFSSEDGANSVRDSQEHKDMFPVFQDLLWYIRKTATKTVYNWAESKKYWLTTFEYDFRKNVQFAHKEMLEDLFKPIMTEEKIVRGDRVPLPEAVGLVLRDIIPHDPMKTYLWFYTDFTEWIKPPFLFRKVAAWDVYQRCFTSTQFYAIRDYIDVAKKDLTIITDEDVIFKSQAFDPTLQLSRHEWYGHLKNKFGSFFDEQISDPLGQIAFASGALVAGVAIGTLTGVLATAAVAYKIYQKWTEGPKELPQMSDANKKIYTDFEKKLWQETLKYESVDAWKRDWVTQAVESLYLHARASRSFSEWHKTMEKLNKKADDIMERYSISPFAMISTQKNEDYFEILSTLNAVMREKLFVHHSLYHIWYAHKSLWSERLIAIREHNKTKISSKQQEQMKMETDHLLFTFQSVVASGLNIDVNLLNQVRQILKVTIRIR